MREKIKGKIWERDNYKCQYCGKEVITQEDIFNMATAEGWSFEEYEKAIANTMKERATLDHKIPLSKEGTNNEDNLITACFSCNAKKGTKIW